MDYKQKLLAERVMKILNNIVSHSILFAVPGSHRTLCHYHNSTPVAGLYKQMEPSELPADATLVCRNRMRNGQG